MGIREVVRGADLLDSTPRQLYLYRLLDLTPPSFCHVPLLLAPDGLIKGSQKRRKQRKHQDHRKQRAPSHQPSYLGNGLDGGSKIKEIPHHRQDPAGRKDGDGAFGNWL